MPSSLNGNSLNYDKIHHFGFFVLPGFSLIALAAGIDTLRLANRFSNSEIYTWKTITVNDERYYR